MTTTIYDLLAGTVTPLLWQQQPIIVSDGATATRLLATGVPIGTCVEALNLTSPEQIQNVHASYVAAGANLIQTNTFAANGIGLARFGLEHQLESINRSGVAIARAAAGTKAAVYGTIGSIAGIRPFGVASDASADLDILRHHFKTQAKALLSAGVDGLLLETFPDLNEMLLALEVVSQMVASGQPIIANLSPEEVGVTRDGVPLEQAFTEMRKHGATVVGLNCKLGPNGILRSYEKLEGNLTLDSHDLYAAMPNAGLLHRVEEHLAYTGDADYFASVIEQLVRLGVRVVGGCCGTTPEYIKAVVKRLTAAEVVNTPTGISFDSSTLDTVSDTVVMTDNIRDFAPQRVLDIPKTAIISVSLTERDKPNLIDMVKTRTTVIVELDPPKTLDCTKYMVGAKALHAAGADFITLADNSLGSVRVSNLALATLLKMEGIEPLLHVACRDRNLIGQQSHLMGFHILDMHHILLVTGDPSKFGDLPGATSVFDVSSIDLTRMVVRLNEGIGFSGQPLKKPSQFVIGTSFNPHVRNFDKAVERLRRKIEAGATYVMTQPVYDEYLMERLAKATQDMNVPIFLGIMPLTSARNANFLHHEVPGINVPEDILQRMQNAPSDAGHLMGQEISFELVDAAIQYFQGLYLITPFLRYELTTDLTRYIKARSTSTEVHDTSESSS